MYSKILLLFFLTTFTLQIYSQTFSHTVGSSFTNSTAQSFTIPVSSVQTGKILREVRLKFGDGSSMYSGELTNATITLTNPSGVIRTLINPASFSSGATDSDRKNLYIKLRDHSYLHTPAGYVTATNNTLSNCYPFSYGYYRSVDTYGAFIGSHNGNWVLTVSYAGLSTTSARKYVSSELIFGDEFEYEDLRTTQPNKSCETRQCMQTGTVYLGTNTGYPNGQAEIPLTVDGCAWNAIRNNSAWFYFTASSSTVELSISGMSAKIESIVVQSTNCSSYTLVNGGCPTTMYNSSNNYTQYSKQNYAGGYSQNHGYTLTGLLPGSQYILILDGLDGSTPTSSNFYIEIASGADGGCCPTIEGTVVTTKTGCAANTGTASLTPTSGTAPFTYNWGAGFVTSNSKNGLAEGNYSVIVKDANGCTTTKNFSITKEVSPTVTVGTITSAACGANTGGIAISVSGGTTPYTYAWSNGSTAQNLTNVAAGNYTVTVTDANGCTATNGTGTTITSTNAPTVTVGTITSAACGANTGGIEISVSGGTTPYTYAWSNGSTAQNLTNVAAGNYTVTVTDANGCSATNGTGTTITSTNAPTVTVGTITSAACGANTGGIEISVSGGTTPYTYSWSNGSTAQNLTNVAAGNYTVTVTDANGCTATNGTGTTITSTNAPTVTVGTITSAACGANTGGIEISVSGGTTPYTYAWSNGSTAQNLTNVAAGNYTVTVTDANGCTATNGTGTTITSTNAPTVTVGTITSAACGANTGGIEISVSGGTTPYTYSWSNGSTAQNLTNVAAGNYTVTVTDANGCTATNGTGTTITSTNAPTVTVGTITSAACGANTGGIEISVSGGTAPYTYFWSNGSTAQNLTNVAAGNYTVTVTDANGCTATNGTGTTITSTNAPIITGQITHVSCGQTGSITLDLNGINAQQITWSNGETTAIISNLTAGTYSVLVIDQNGCEATQQFVVNNNSSFAIQTSVTAPTCGFTDGSITTSVVNGSGDYQYLYLPNNVNGATLNNVGQGQYQVRVTDQNGCVVEETINVVATGVHPSSITASTLTVEEGNSANLNVSLSPYIPGITYSWSPAATLSCNNCPNPVAKPTESTCYVVTLASPDGCVSKDSVCINFKPFCGEIFAPTIFSPNQDGNNDEFKVHGRCIMKMQMSIYDRWGERVFYSDDFTEGWDGTFRGKPMNSGTFVYKLSVTLLDGTYEFISGNVTLVR